MKFKRIYIEITNICNLKCSFCSNSKRNKKEMSIDEFELVMSKITMYTDYIYLHVMGEALSHHYLDDILSICKKYNKKVCITTNGVFLKDRLDILSKYDNIYQINISLHSENNKDNYLEDIFEVVDNLEYPYISYDKMKLDNKVYLSLDSKFDWPSTSSSYYKEEGTCLGGKSQLAILSNGVVSICCLDSEGESNLGNIFTDSMEDIISSDKFKNTINGFNDNKVYLDICKHCSYKERFNKKNI